jgi:3-hydroxybutyryl-CoA dehydrogenase
VHLPQDTGTCIGVVGAGTIGRGVAQRAAECDYDVVLVDLAPSVLEAAWNEIANALRLASLLRRESSPDADRVLSRIVLTTDPGKLADASIVVENIPELLQAKVDEHRRLASIVSREAVVACNTSAIPIAALAQAYQDADPSRILGIHFMNPVPMKAAAEVIPHEGTSAHAMEVAKQFVVSLGQEPLVVRDLPGFVSNRVLMLTINEAVRAYEDGVASAEGVDAVFRKCFGHAMGPLETADLIGLDTVVLSLNVLRDSLGSDRFEPAAMLTELVEQGRCGKKTGRGFYTYLPAA